MSKATVLVDMDDTIENLLSQWLTWLNNKYKTEYKPQDIRKWELSDYFQGISRDKVFEPLHLQEFWDTVEPKEDAVKYLKMLIDDGFKIVIVTSTHYSTVQPKMERVLFKYFPYLSWKDVIIADNKQLIDGDYLIDDGIHNLIGGKYKKILYTAPHNEDIDVADTDITRVCSWEEIYLLLNCWEREE